MLTPDSSVRSCLSTSSLELCQATAAEKQAERGPTVTESAGWRAIISKGV